MSTYGSSRVFPECEACGHPKVSHAEGSCFCGCSGAKREPEVFHLETVRTAARYRDGWSQEEDVLLEQRFADGMLISKLSGLHQRRPSAIIARLEQLRLVEPRRRTG